MTPRQALASALHFFVVLVFFGVGFFFICLPYLPELRVQLADMILYRPDAFPLMGLGFFVTSFLLFLGFYTLNRGRFLKIIMGQHLAEVDVKVIRDTVEQCFKAKFPQISLQDLEVIWGRKLEINVTVGSVENEQELFVKAENELSSLLKHRFGYHKKFFLIVQK